MTTFFKQTYSGHFFCRLTVHIANTTGSESKLPESFNISQYQKTYFKPILEKIATSFNKDSFFSNKRILTICFVYSQFTKHTQLVLSQEYRELALFHNTKKPTLN